MIDPKSNLEILYKQLELLVASGTLSEADQLRCLQAMRQLSFSILLEAAAKAKPLPNEKSALDDSHYLLARYADGCEGLFPYREVSVIHGPSGAGKTTWGINMLEAARKGEPFLGHNTQAIEYGLILNDRSEEALRKTVEFLKLPSNIERRVHHLTYKGHAVEDYDDPRQPKLIFAAFRAALRELLQAHSNYRAWFIEGLDLYVDDEKRTVKKLLRILSEEARAANVAIIGSTGAPKEKGHEQYARSREKIPGTQAWGRMVETTVELNFADPNDESAGRICSIHPRRGPGRYLFLCLGDDMQLYENDPPDYQSVIDTVNEAQTKKESSTWEKYIATIPAGGELKYYKGCGVPEGSYYRLRSKAKEAGTIYVDNGKYYKTPSA